MNVVIFIAYTGSQFTNSPGTFFRSAAQIPLHKMYTFVYRTFIKFILFCRGQAPDVSNHSFSATVHSLTYTSCLSEVFNYATTDILNYQDIFVRSQISGNDICTIFSFCHRCRLLLMLFGVDIAQAPNDLK